MSASQILCGKCKIPVPLELFNLPMPAPCPRCSAPLQIEVFPAFYRPPAPASAPERLLDDSEASCFYHPQKKAVIPCEACGRFLCALCDCELNGQHLCPACVEAGRKKGKIKSLENHRVRYDSIALSLSLLPLLIFYLTFITAPLAIFVAIRHWNSPTSIVKRGKSRFILAIIIASLEILGWIWAIYGLTHRHTR